MTPEKQRIRPITHDGTWNEDELISMANGHKLDRNGKRYGVCSECRKVVRLDKPLIGTIHICL